MPQKRQNTTRLRHQMIRNILFFPDASGLVHGADCGPLTRRRGRSGMAAGLGEGQVDTPAAALV